jgi:hypothetical protein
MTDEEYARFVKTWNWAEFGAAETEAGAQGTAAPADIEGASGEPESEDTRAPAAPEDVVVGASVTEDSNEASRPASAPAAPEQGALL